MTPIVTVDDLAKALGIPKYALTRYVFKANRLYKTFRIGKPSGHGYRTINAPSAELKGLQRWIVRNVLRAVKLHIAASAFRPGCSIVNNAKPHAGHDFVFNADLRDYFPSITSRRIFGLFRALGFANELAAAFTRLTTRAGELPQGAPTSPELANIIARRLDSRLDGLCQRCGWRYTRYCDDITVSGNGVFGGAKRVIEAIIASEGFEVNTKKTRVHRRGQSQMVTGLVVNEFPNVPRSQRRKKSCRQGPRWLLGEPLLLRPAAPAPSSTAFPFPPPAPPVQHLQIVLRCASGSLLWRARAALMMSFRMK
jgi:RNA-directed DNA polymerase